MGLSPFRRVPVATGRCGCGPARGDDARQVDVVPGGRSLRKRHGCPRDPNSSRDSRDRTLTNACGSGLRCPRWSAGSGDGRCPPPQADCYPRLLLCVERHRRRGRSGPGALRELLHGWDQVSPPESVLESRLLRVMHKHNLPRFESQLEVRVQGRKLRLDVAYPAERVAIEADGYRWHGDVARWQGDLARRNLLTAAGWSVLHFTWRDLDRDPAGVADQIRRCLATSRNRKGVT